MQTAAAVLQLDNIPEREDSVIRIPQPLYGWGKRTLTSKAVIAGEIFSYSQNGKICYRTHSNFRSRLHLGIATISRKINSLINDGYIKKVGQSAYTFNEDIKFDTFLRIEEVMLTSTFKFYADVQRNRTEEIRELKPSEALIFAWFYTRCNNGKRLDKNIYCSISMIARELDLSEKTVCVALQELRRCRLIFMSAKGVNSSVLSRYRLHTRLYNRIMKGKKAARANTEPTPEDKRIERERYYSDLRAAAEERAERNLRKAMQIKGFKEIEGERKTLEINMAFAEELHDPKFADMQKRAAELQSLRTAALKRLGLTAEDLLPRYRCKLCNDTGYDTRGKPCTCYPGDT